MLGVSPPIKQTKTTTYTVQGYHAIYVVQYAVHMTLYICVTIMTTLFLFYSVMAVKGVHGDPQGSECAQNYLWY